MYINIKEKILEYIKVNRVSTTEIADALGKTGVLEAIYPIKSGHFKAGNVFYVYGYGESNWFVHEQIENADKGDIVFIQSFDCKNRAIIGDLVSKYLILYRQVEAIVVDGIIRDVPIIMKENWPVWCKGFSPVGCFNTKIEINESLYKEYWNIYNGSLAVCDDSGVVIIPKEVINENFLDKLKFIEEQEDIWYDCLDRKKMSTYEIVCLKKYLNTNN